MTIITVEKDILWKLTIGFSPRKTVMSCGSWDKCSSNAWRGFGLLNVNIGYLVSVDSYMNLQASATSLCIVGEKYLCTYGDSWGKKSHASFKVCWCNFWVSGFILFHCICFEVWYGSSLFVGCDYVQLASTEEYVDGSFTGNLGEVLIRWVSSIFLLVLQVS